MSVSRFRELIFPGPIEYRAPTLLFYALSGHGVKGGFEVRQVGMREHAYNALLTVGKVTRHLLVVGSYAGLEHDWCAVEDGLAAYPNACVVWLTLDSTNEIREFRWYGEAPGKPLPDLSRFRRMSVNNWMEIKPANGAANPAVAGEPPPPITPAPAPENVSGNVREVRPALRAIPQSEFEQVPDLQALLGKLFGEPV